MIEKIEFLSIIGPKDQLDRVTEKYLGRYEIQLENTVAELKNLKDIVPNTENNPYREWVGKAQAAVALLKEKQPVDKGKMSLDGTKTEQMTPEEAIAVISAADEAIEEHNRSKSRIQEERKKKTELLESIRPFLELHFEVSRILHFQNVKFRFGRIPVAFYQKLKEYVYEDICTIFEKCREDDSYIWGVYFVPKAESEKVDAIYASMHFERLFIEDAYEGTVDEAFLALLQVCLQLEE